MEGFENNWYREYEKEQKEKALKEILESHEYKIGRELIKRLGSIFNLYDDISDILNSEHFRKFVKKSIDYFLKNYFKKLEEFHSKYND